MHLYWFHAHNFSYGCDVANYSLLLSKWIDCSTIFLLVYLLQWGYVVITTPNGVLDHEEAIKQNVGGQVLGFFH